jgi:DNA-binding response OmpR family regulator
MQTIDSITSPVFRPRAGKIVPGLRQAPKVEAQHLRIRLLVVDDEHSIRELVALYFGIKGLRVTTAGTVAEARALIQRDEFDLLILDWRLGGAEGLDLLNLSKAKHPQLPVLIFTGAEDSEDLLKKAFAGRADAVVRKMGSFEALAAEVFAHLDRPDQDGASL